MNITTILNTLDDRDLLLVFDIAKKHYLDYPIKDNDSKLLIVRSYIYAFENVVNNKIKVKDE